MSKQRVQDAAAAQVPDLDDTVIRRRQEQRAGIIERYGVHRGVMRIIVLQQSVRSTVEYLDLLVGAARCYASAVRMELHLVDHARVIIELVNLPLHLNVPDAHCTVVTAGRNHARITRKLRALNPVLMAREGLQE